MVADRRRARARGQAALGPGVQSVFRVREEHAESRAQHGAVRRRGTGDAPGRLRREGRGSRTLCEARAGRGPNFPTRHAPRIPAAARSCGEVSPSLRARVRGACR